MPNKEFDFESANAKFQKQKQTADDEATTNGNAAVLEAIPPPSSESPGNFYDKKSGFFDNISSEIKERYDRSTLKRWVEASLTTPLDVAEEVEGGAGEGRIGWRRR